MTVVVVRATVNLPNLRRGDEALSDPEHPYVAKCIRAGLVEIVRVVEEPSVEAPSLPVNEGNPE